MDKFINEQEQRILELVETKTFSELSDEERILVLNHFTQQEFDLQHLLIHETKSLTDELHAKPLVLNEKKSGLVIPLYQAIIGVAASLIISFLLFQAKQSPISESKNVELAIADTVYIEKQVLDTVIKYEYVDRIVFVDAENKVSENAPKTPNQQGITIAQPFVAPLDELKLQNKGLTLVNDETYSLVSEMNVENGSYLLDK